MSHVNRGVGDYERAPWGSIFYNYGQYLPAKKMGLGCSSCQSKGVGLFDSGLDVSGWGIAEWAIAGIGIYALASTFVQTKRNYQRVRRVVRRRRS